MQKNKKTNLDSVLSVLKDISKPHLTNKKSALKASLEELNKIDRAQPYEEDFRVQYYQASSGDLSSI
jgi:hypothetical protein